ncbi:MAG TPA: SLATT domain-containing protein [Candidatus Binatia bacterium]|jgi:hypothetical protein
MPKRTDIQHSPLPKLEWEPSKRQNSLELLFDHLTAEAKSAIDWYLKAKRPKQQWAMRARMGAIVLTALAGIIPMVVQIFVEDGKPLIQPAWASVSLGIAAAMIVVDRFFGFSSGWMRYISAELRIRQLLREFELEWQTLKAGWKGSDPTDDQVQTMLGRAKTFINQVTTVVQEETNTWIREFQESLKQVEEAARAKAAVSELGGLNVTVTNGDQSAAVWKLSIDGGSPANYTGKSAALRELSPGVHVVKAEGIINGTPKASEISVTIPAGGIGKAELTLS